MTPAVAPAPPDRQPAAVHARSAGTEPSFDEALRAVVAETERRSPRDEHETPTEAPADGSQAAVESAAPKRPEEERGSTMAAGRGAPSNGGEAASAAHDGAVVPDADAPASPDAVPDREHAATRAAVHGSPAGPAPTASSASSVGVNGDATAQTSQAATATAPASTSTGRTEVPADGANDAAPAGTAAGQAPDGPADGSAETGTGAGDDPDAGRAPTTAEPDLEATGSGTDSAGTDGDGAEGDDPSAPRTTRGAERHTDAGPRTDVAARPESTTARDGQPSADPRSVADGAQPTAAPSSNEAPAGTAAAPRTPPTAAPAATAPAPAPAPPPVAQQLVGHVTPLLARGSGTHDLSIELLPGDLGRVRLEVTLDDGVLHVVVHADKPESRQLLAGALGDLRASLEQAGLQAGDLDVRDGSDGRAGDGGDAEPRSERGSDSPGPAAHGTDRPLVRSTSDGRTALDVLL